MMSQARTSGHSMYLGRPVTPLADRSRDESNTPTCQLSAVVS
jgi:hypothetical protein